MSAVEINNVVFDIGNVIVRWSPTEIVKLTFSDINDLTSDKIEQLAKSTFHSEIWQDLNKGRITEAQAKKRYIDEQNLSAIECERLFYYVKQTQLLIYGSIDLLKRIKAAGYGTYALTDNVVDIVEYLKSTYTFWQEFDGTTVSAEVGLLKPQPEIYQSLLTQFQLQAEQTVFIDDMPYNVQGARDMGMSAIQFVNAQQCEQDLKALGLRF